MRKIVIFLFIILSVSAVRAQEIVVGTCKVAGGSYTGEMFRGKPWGKGKAIYANGDVYEGQFEKGRRQGEGTYTFSDGE